MRPFLFIAADSLNDGIVATTFRWVAVTVNEQRCTLDQRTQRT
jgi:hypothetical protein